MQHTNGRVLVFTVPARPRGVALEVGGVAWMRTGDSLIQMDHARKKTIYEELSTDFSAEMCVTAAVEDLAPEAIDILRSRWRDRTLNQELLHKPVMQFLVDAELVIDGRPTWAALILLGKELALRRELPQAELKYEYRSTEIAGPAQQRIEFRAGYFLYLDRLWDLINQRNSGQHFQEGLFLREISTFDERSVREAINNAVSHRDYTRQGSVFVRQYDRRLIVESPGGFPEGITPENILWRHYPRNRRIAETLERAGLVERSGQGANLMFEQAIRQGKALPEYSYSDEYQVTLNLQGLVQDPDFLRFLEHVGEQTLLTFSTQDFLLLDRIRRSEKVDPDQRPRLNELRNAGILERIGHGRGSRFILATEYYRRTGRLGERTRRRGLDRRTKMEFLVRHVSDRGSAGAPFREFQQVLPDCTEGELKSLLRSLREDRRLCVVGRGPAARWHLAETLDEHGRDH